MFGYVTPDKPNMYIKDYTMYKAFYCGICKKTGKMYGQLMRFTTNYDITFINILLHNILEQKVEIINQTCILNPIKKKSIVVSNHLTEQVINLNVLLADFKLDDDIIDNNKLSKKFFKFLIRRKVKRARQKLPEIYERIRKARIEQNNIENDNNKSIDKAAHPFASMIRDIFKLMAKERYTEDIGSLAYQLGRFIYIVDAIDDIDKDILNKDYNPVKLYYPDIYSKEDLFDKHSEDVDFILNSTYNEIRRCYSNTDFKLCEGVVTNILWYGLKSTINKIMGRNYAKESN